MVGWGNISTSLLPHVTWKHFGLSATACQSFCSTLPRLWRVGWRTATRPSTTRGCARCSRTDARRSRSCRSRRTLRESRLGCTSSEQQARRTTTSAHGPTPSTGGWSHAQSQVLTSSHRPVQCIGGWSHAQSQVITSAHGPVQCTGGWSHALSHSLPHMIS